MKQQKNKNLEWVVESSNFDLLLYMQDIIQVSKQLKNYSSKNWKLVYIKKFYSVKIINNVKN